MMPMIEIDGTIVATDILTERFRCDLALCKGICCVEGDSGAPLEPQEAAVLESQYAAYRPYMTRDGIAVAEKQGFGVVDRDGDLTTPLVRGAECAYAFREDGVTLCAIEKAYKEGTTDFRKPLSCHLYPIRVKKFRDGSVGLNYHRWAVCNAGNGCGTGYGVPVYQTLREPIVRAFGEEFYEALGAAARLLEEETGK